MIPNKNELQKLIVVANRNIKEKNYWLNQLAGFLVRTSIPTDNGKTGTNERCFGTIPFKLEGTLFSRLMEISGETDNALFVILMTGLVELLRKYTGSKDILVGVPICKQDIEGEFVNTILPIRSRIQDRMTFKELLLQLSQTFLEANENQNYPVEILVHQLNSREFSPGNDFPLFDTTIFLESIHDKRYLGNIHTNVNISFKAASGYLEGVVEYSSVLYQEATAARMVIHYINLLKEAIFYPNRELSTLKMLSKDEKERLLVEFNRTSSGYPKDKTLHELLEQQVEKTPDHTALIGKLPNKNDNLQINNHLQIPKNNHSGARRADLNASIGNISISYRELNKRSDQLAYLLQEKGVQPDNIVGITGEPSVEMVLFLFGILKAGAAYLPVEADYPEERMRYMLADSDANMFISTGSLFDDSLIGNWEGEIILLNTALRNSFCRPLPAVSPSNLAYVIYTSGSTGKPKGVMVEHQNVVNYTWWAIQRYVKNDHVNFPLFTSVTFDLTVTSIYTPLLSGNALVVYGKDSWESLIEEIIEDDGVGVVKLTPSHLKLILEQKEQKGNKIKSFIKRFIVGGEDLKTQLAREISELFHEAPVIYNEYGPTEATVGCMTYIFCPEMDRRQSVPIGIPGDNVQLYILNKDKNILPVGAPGELHISGDGLVRGYLNRPQLTAERFVENMFLPGTRLYKTGDLAKFLEDGNIEFLGRIDHQVKIRGYRLELGEIQSQLLEYKKHKPISMVKDDPKITGLKEVRRCTRCLLPVNYPGIRFDNRGVCNKCLEYEKYKDKVNRYFETRENFKQLVEKVNKTKKGEYDCLLLFSGGKDSSYVLYQLIGMGLKVLTFTFDNGFISDITFANIEGITSKLGVENIVCSVENMNKVFVESLNTHHNVCQGCWNALNTLGAKLAHEKEINLVISGLSRGQIFEMRLEALFQQGIFEEKEIQENLLLFRKAFHSNSNKFSRILDIQLAEDIVEQIYFVDFFRYVDTPVPEINTYLSEKGWTQPGDTGFCSSNCLINDVGIYQYLKEKGHHFYDNQLSWDCRLGSITREQALKKIEYAGNLQQVDNILKEIGYYDSPIKNVVILDKENDRGDKYLVAYIVAEEELNGGELRKYLEKKLPDYMIPSFFVQLEKIPLTLNGKVDRKALPHPEIKQGDDFVAPGNELEMRLASIWAEVLGLEKDILGIDANFFDLGGHSIKAAILVGKIHKTFNVYLPLAEVFKNPTIRRMVGYMKTASPVVYSSIEPQEEKEYYDLSYHQKRLWVINQLEARPLYYNISGVIPMAHNIDIDALKKTLTHMMERHEGFRTTFKLVDGQPVQVVVKHVKVPFRVVDLSSMDPGEKQRQRNLLVEEETGTPFSLDTVPLFRSTLIKLADRRWELVYNTHHIISDGWSMEILKNEFSRFYEGYSSGQTAAHQPLKVQYKDFTAWHLEKLSNPALKEKSHAFWQKKLEQGMDRFELPVDFEDNRGEREGAAYDYMIPNQVKDGLNRLARDNNTTLFTVMFAAYNILFARFSGQKDILCSIINAGREHDSLQQVVGYFINSIPILTHVDDEETFSDLLTRVKTDILEVFECQSYPFELVLEDLNMKHPYVPVALNLTNMTDMTDVEIDSSQSQHIDHGPAYFDIVSYAAECKNGISISVSYNKKLFKASTIQSIANSYQQLLAYIAAGVKREDEK
jgi:amino acid adenylation domain-containing protein